MGLELVPNLLVLGMQIYLTIDRPVIVMVIAGLV